MDALCTLPDELFLGKYYGKFDPMEYLSFGHDRRKCKYFL